MSKSFRFQLRHVPETGLRASKSHFRQCEVTVSSDDQFRDRNRRVLSHHACALAGVQMSANSM